MKTPEEAGRRYLLLAAGDRLVAVESRLVRRILRALPVTPLPGARPELLGLAEFAGEPVPVLDLAQLVGAGPGPPASFPVTVVVRAGPQASEILGLAADAAVDLLSIPPSAVVPVSEGLVAGEALAPQGTVEILDLSRLGQP
jgi:chemotaxis signal transduction protein